MVIILALNTLARLATACSAPLLIGDAVVAVDFVVVVLWRLDLWTLCAEDKEKTRDDPISREKDAVAAN